MTIGIAVEGNDIAAYACNGVDDEAWFFGTQNTGSIDITGKFRDTLKASFDGKDVVGDLTMNGVPFRFTAAKVPDPAGMYTAELDGVRSSWVVRPDGSATGVQITGAASTLDQADIERLKDQQFRDEVRNKRKLQQAAQLTRLQNGAFTSTINDKPVTPVLVTGTFRL